MRLSSVPYLLLAIQVIFAAGPSLDLPSFPNDYQVFIEVDDLVEQKTTRRSEYFDSIQNKGRYDTLDQEKTVFLLFNFAEERQYEIFDSQVCRAGPLQVNQDPRKEESFQKMSAKKLFDYGNTFPAKYVGKSTVRGIECDYWSRTVELTEADTVVSYTIDYYFADDQWKMTEGFNPIYRNPIRVAVNGTRMKEGQTQFVSLGWEFFQFQVGVPSPLVFEIVNILQCETTPEKDFPRVPLAFSTLIERTNTRLNFTDYVQQWRDTGRDKIRFDLSTNEGSYTQIYQMDKVLFRISNGSKCSVETISASVPGDLRTISFMPESKELMLSQHFMGVKSVRGISCSCWRRRVTVLETGKPNTTQTVVYYFSNDWNIAGIRKHSTIPIRIELYHENTLQPIWIFDYLKFSPLESINEHVFLTCPTSTAHKPLYSVAAVVTLSLICFFFGLGMGGFFVGVFLYARIKQRVRSLYPSQDGQIQPTTITIDNNNNQNPQ